MAKLADKEKKVVEPKSQKKISKSKGKETKSEVKPKIVVKKKSTSVKKEEIEKASEWSLEKGNFSGRTAYQFILSLKKN